MKKIIVFLSFAFIAAAASAQIVITSPDSAYDAEPPWLSADFSPFNNFVVLQIAQADPDLQKLSDDEFVYDAVLNKKGKFTKVDNVKGEHRGLSAWGKIRLLQAPKWAPATRNGEPVDINVRITLHLSTIYPIFGNQGGIKEFANYVEKKLVYPEGLAAQGVAGRPVVSFTVMKDGKLDPESVKITGSPDQEITDEIMQTLLEAPGWVPGMVKGVPQEFSYDMPLDVRPAADGAK